MATYLPFVNTIVSVLLAAACWWLYRDGRGRRTAAAAAKLPPSVAWETDMLVRVVGHDLRITSLERLVPGPVSSHSPALARVAAQGSPPPVSVAQPPSGGLPVRLVSTLVEGAASASETQDQIRARLEATEDEREKARTAGKAFDDEDERKARTAGKAFDDEDERTVVKDAGDVRAAFAEATGALPPPVAPPMKPPTPIASRRATLLGVPPERARVAASYRSRQGSSPTLVSAGNVLPQPPPSSSNPRLMPLDRIAKLSTDELARVDALAAAHHVSREAMLAIIVDTGAVEMEARALAQTAPPSGPMVPPPIPRAPPPLSARVERRWHELLASARAQGKHVEHCSGSVCLRDGYRVGPCPCECEGCARIEDLLARAKREIGWE